MRYLLVFAATREASETVRRTGRPAILVDSPPLQKQAKAGRVGDVICGIPLVMLPFEAQQKIVSAMLEASPVRGFLHLSYCITSPLPSAKLGLTGRRQAWTIKNFPPGGVWRYAPINPAKAG